MTNPQNALGATQTMSQALPIQTNPETPLTASPLPRNAITCPRCDNWWTGLTACHCSACHRNFTSIAAFDRHRSGSHALGTRHCVDPATVFTEKGDAALVPANKPWVGWSLPGSWDGPELTVIGYVHEDETEEQ